MKNRFTSPLAALTLVGALLSSCVYYSHPVPDMPYRPHRRSSTVKLQPALQSPAPMAPGAAVAPAPGHNPAANPGTPAVAPAPAPKPQAPAGNSGHHITPQAPAPKPAAPAPKPAPAPVPPAPAPQDNKLISNDGPIPVATRVPGDPLRVFNPLDPSKKIKITDKNGNPHPSGKKLRVPGTNFYFYVP